MVQSIRVQFESYGTDIVGQLYLPESEIKGAIVLTGPLTSVKEQVAGNYAAALAEQGFAGLAFDHRYFGESGGEPRQYESPPQKIEDIRSALTFLEQHAATQGKPLGAVGICAGAGYMAGAVATDPRILAWGAVAGFFHDAEQQKAWMGEEGLATAIAKAQSSKQQFEATGELEMIPAVGKEGDVAMPLAEAYEYYGTPRGAVPNYVNQFAVLSRADTLPYDAQGFAGAIAVPSLLIHSEKALMPALARKFYDGLAGKKEILWFESQGQIDFYDDPKMIQPAVEQLATHFSSNLSSSD